MVADRTGPDGWAVDGAAAAELGSPRVVAVADPGQVAIADTTNARRTAGPPLNERDAQGT